MQTPTKIYFRADGNHKIGLGHVIRSLALAEMLRPYFHLHFIIRAPDQVLLAQIHQICHQITVIRAGLSFENEANYLKRDIIKPRSVVVLDGYQFDTEYQRVLQQDTLKLVCIDDIFSCRFLADVIINHGGGITEAMYSAERYTKFFLGPRYALLRKPFRDSNPLNEREAAIFICLGGADPNNDVIKVVERLAELDTNQRVYIVVGSAYRSVKMLKERLKLLTIDYEILKNLSAEQMAAYMSRCPIAITSPSSVAYEYLSIGGVLYLLQTADNQKHMFQYLTSSGLALPWERFPENNARVLENLMNKQKDIFDGKADQRLYKIFRDLDHDLNSTLRKANPDDLMLIFQWANDPATRAQSFHPKPITLEEHQNWYLQQLADPDSFFYLLEYQNEPVGQVRFNIKQSRAIISYAIAGQFRGRGFGKLILEKGIAAFKNDYPQAIPIAGYVKKRNLASVYTFEKLRFSKEETQDYEDSYVFIRN